MQWTIAATNILIYQNGMMHFETFEKMTQSAGDLHVTFARKPFFQLEKLLCPARRF
jgi:hypothetical protein